MPKCPYHFVMMEIEEDAQITVVLGWPFLAMVVVMIKVKNGSLSMQVGEEKLEFSLSKVTASLSFENAYY